MIPKFVLSSSLAALLVVGVASAALVQQTPQEQPKQNQTASQSASGKVTKIGKDKKSFSVQTNDQDKRTLTFMINGDTQIKGQVTVGTDVDVEYRVSPDGNVALVITPRTSGGH